MKWIGLVAFLAGLLLLVLLTNGMTSVVRLPVLPPDDQLVEDLVVSCENPFLPSMYRHGYNPTGDRATSTLRVFGPFVRVGEAMVHGPALVWITYEPERDGKVTAVFLSFPDQPVEQITFQGLQERYADVCAVYEQWKASVKTPV